MLSVFKPSIDNIAQKIVDPMDKVNPNLLTLIGIVPSILFFLSIHYHSYGPALFFYLGNFLDLLDGAVARKFHKVTQFGGFLDSTLDRIADFFLISSFGFAHLVSWEMVTTLLFVSYLVSYARSRAELASGATQKFAVGWIERPERLAILFFGFLLYLISPSFLPNKFPWLDVTFMVLIFLSTITFLQRVWIAYKCL